MFVGIIYLGEANGRWPDPNDGVDKREVVAPDPALGVIINLRKSALVSLCDGGSV